jgi:glycosyltransferase involved in cell wall biosynthesis
MRILYITAHYPPDFVSGATLQVRRLAESVARLGHDVTVLSGAINDHTLADGAVRTEQLDGVSIHWLGTAARVHQHIDANWVNPSATQAAAALIDKIRPDVVHGHALQTLGAEALAVAAARSVRTVVTLHDFWWWCARLFLVDRELRPCDGLLPTSSCACASTATWRQERRSRLEPVLATMDLVLTPSRTMMGAVRSTGTPLLIAVDENDLDPCLLVPIPRRSHDLVRFLYVGGDSPLKGRDVVLAAAARLSDMRGWRIDLRGVEPSNRRQRWRRGRQVRYLPPYAPEETGAVLADSDVVVIASIARESFSIVAREALRAGRCVITSDCLGPEEVVRDGFNGLVVPSGDARALADAMRRLIVQPDLRQTLQANAATHPIPVRTTREHAVDLVARYEALRADSAR